jgi:hypothetical protein
MNFDQILSKFNQGINWNAYLYVFYKVTSTIVTFCLFRHLTTEHFAVWANIYSIIYLVLLWADFGFRKSLPRYCPEFSRNTSAIKRFIRGIILFQTIVLTCATPLIIVASYKLTSIFDISSITIFSAIPAIFAIEGLVSIVRLIYHSHFWQKSFNLLYSIVITGEALTNMFFIFSINKSQTLLKTILLTKLLAGLIIIIGSIIMLFWFYKGNEHEKTDTIDYDHTMKGFIKHSTAMWGNTILKSLSERNFLLPLLTIIAGAESASIFKLAHDGALLFQRIVLKTIGTTDTSLLAYVNALPDEKKLTNIAFRKLATKIATLCLPLLGVLVLIIGFVSDQVKSSWGFRLFCILTINYLLESMLLPFERLLEVKRTYIYLAGVYGCYVLMISILLSILAKSWIGLSVFVLLLCGVRLVCLLLMAWAGSVLFNVSAPFSTYGFIARRTLFITGMIYVLFLRVPVLHKGFNAFIRLIMKIP